MTQRDALHTAGGVISASDARYAQNGLFRADTSGSAITPRAGVIPAPNSPYLIEATGPISMNVTVRAGNCVTVRNGQGYLSSNDALWTQAIPTVPGTGSRYDVIYVKQNDATDQGDATSAGIIGLVSGPAASTPSLSAATALVPAGGLILGWVQVYSTDSGGISSARITNAPVYTGVRGGILIVPDSDASAGAQVGDMRDIPSKGLQRWNGTTWGPPSLPNVIGITPNGGWVNANGLGGWVDASGQKHLTGWISNTNTFTPAGGEILCNALPTSLIPVKAAFFEIPVSVGQDSVQVNITTAGQINIARPATFSIGSGALWSMDVCAYL